MGCLRAGSFYNEKHERRETCRKEGELRKVISKVGEAIQTRLLTRIFTSRPLNGSLPR